MQVIDQKYAIHHQKNTSDQQKDANHRQIKNASHQPKKCNMRNIHCWFYIDIVYKCMSTQ